MSLSDNFYNMLSGHEEDAAFQKDAAEMVLNATESAERDGLLSLMYHEGIGVPVNLDRSFEYAEKAAFHGRDGLGYFMLGHMCDNAETPDQAEGGSRQKYDHYDAERFYEICSDIESRWKDLAILWLGDYYMDMAKGGDPEIAVEYYEKIASHNAEAAGKLSDYYWDLVMPEYIEDEEWTSQLFKWTSVAAHLNPEKYSDRAKSIAKIFEEFLEDDLDAEDRAECENNMMMWNERGDSLREKGINEHIDKFDNTNN